METITCQVRVDKEVDVEVHCEDVIEAINEMPMPRRWNYIAKILNEVDIDNSEFTEGQKEIVQNYLTKKIALFAKK